MLSTLWTSADGVAVKDVVMLLKEVHTHMTGTLKVNGWGAHEGP